MTRQPESAEDRNTPTSDPSLRTVIAREQVRAEEARARQAAVAYKGEALLEGVAKLLPEMARELKAIRKEQLDGAIVAGETQAEVIRLGVAVSEIVVRVRRLEAEDITSPQTPTSISLSLPPEVAAELAVIKERLTTLREKAAEFEKADERASGHFEALDKERIKTLEERGRHYTRAGVAFLLAAALAAVTYALGRWHMPASTPPASHEGKRP